MDRAAKASKTPVPATPARPVPAPALRPTAAAALQSRVGASGVHRMLAAQGKANDDTGRRKGAARPGKGDAAAPPDVAAGGEKAAGASVTLLMPAAPTRPSPATLGRIAGVRNRAAGKATAQADLPVAEDQVADAQHAVTPPDAQRAAEARAELMKRIDAKPSQQIIELCQTIRANIGKKRPESKDDLDNANPEQSAREAGNALDSNVSSQTQHINDNYQSMETNPPGGPVARAPDVPPQPPAAGAPAPGARAATPDAVPARNVSLTQDAEATRKKSEAAGMDKPAAQLVQSGPIAEARAAQGELDQVAREDPAAVLAKQKEALATAQADLGDLQIQALAALNASRAGTVKKTGDRQHAMVGTESDMRIAAGEEAKKAFERAQSAVRAQLTNLVPKHMAMWEADKGRLVHDFKTDLKIVSDYVADRHSGVLGSTVVALADWATGLPDEVIVAYNKAERTFSEGVIESVTRISTSVNLIIGACDIIIQDARNEIKGIYDKLPASLQKWAGEEQQKFSAQFDKLHDEVAKTRDDFNKDLIGRSTQAVDEVRDEIEALRAKAGGLVGRIVAAVGRFLDDPVKFIIEGLLDLLGISPPAFWAVVAKIKKVVRDIIDDPMGFANNLMSGIGQGFSQFFDNFGTHMIRGFLSWLLGDLKDVQIPKDVSARSIITFFLQIMGITWPNIRKIIAKKIGEKNVALIEKVWSLVSMLIEKGPEGIYDMIKQALDPQAIIDQVIQMAVDFMVTAIAKQAAIRIALLFNPAGAILQAIEAIYRVLKWVFQNAAKIFTLIETIVNGLADIIAGNIGGFANAVEKGLEMLIAPVLGFIADYFSLGDLPKMVAKQIKSFREWILGKIEAGFDWIIEKGKALLAAVGVGGKDKDKKGDGEDGTVGEDVPFEAAGEAHRLWIETNGNEARIMVASKKQGLEEFLNSKAVKDAASDPDVRALVKRAKDLWGPLRSKADAVIKALKDVKDDKKAGKATGDNDKVKSDEHQLAEVISDIMEAMAGTQPFAGLHGIIRQVPTKDKEPRNSHHVPAKALGSAAAQVLMETSTRLLSDPWDDDPAAQSLSAHLKFRAQGFRAISETGDDLSAISLSYKSHKGVRFGVHSLGSGRVLQGLAKNPARTRILQVRRQTEVWIRGRRSYVSVNPSTASWRTFLADIRRQLDKTRLTMDLGKGRTPADDNAAEEMLGVAESAMASAEYSTREILENLVVDRIEATLDEGIERAYSNGKAVVRVAMQKYSDGDEAGQTKALADLDQSFRSSWAPFRGKITF